MRRLIPYAGAAAAVAITTALIDFVVGRAQIANISMLYLLAVLVVAVAEHCRAALGLDAVSIEADADILPHPAIAAPDDAARDSLRAAGTQLQLMDSQGSSRRIRLIGPQMPGRTRDNRARMVPIVS